MAMEQKRQPRRGRTTASRMEAEATAKVVRTAADPSTHARPTRKDGGAKSSASVRRRVEKLKSRQNAPLKRCSTQSEACLRRRRVESHRRAFGEGLKNGRAGKMHR